VHIKSVFGNDDRCAAFAVYDGHGGDEVSTYLKDSLLQAILDHITISRAESEHHRSVSAAQEHLAAIRSSIARLK